MGLINRELRNGPSSMAYLGSSSHSVVRLLPKALEVDGIAPNKGLVVTDNARYVTITLDIYEFTKMIETYFSIEEQQDLCLRLGLDYQSAVPSNATKLVSAQAIVDHMRRDSRLMKLWFACVQVRPNSDWTRLLRG